MQVLRLLLIALIFPLSANAAPIRPEQVPEPLKPWVDWVLLDQPERNCPFLFNDFAQKRCLWPTRLELDLENRQGQFSMDWAVYRESWIGLPGSRKHWPRNVSIDGQPALVLDRNGVPSIRINPKSDAAKTYDVKGRFMWDSIPETLSVPADAALIRLTLNGQPIEIPSVKDDQLWLKENDTGRSRVDSAQNSVDIQVFRKIVDDVPMQIDMRLVVEVSGEARDIKLPPSMPDGYIPLSLQSPLPARLEPDGSLLLQARAGRWQIQLTARSSGIINAIAFNPIRGKLVNSPDGAPLWPQSEIWVYAAKPELRVAEIEGVDAVDPTQTNLPEEWKSLPAYRLDSGRRMIFKTLRRGDPDPEPNQLNINRKLWLDFDGGGYTANDTISGTMSREWRLDAAPEVELGRVVLNGSNQLITQTPNGNRKGVEVRRGRISLLADSRITGAIDRIDAIGWDQRFRSVSAVLNLPPGWRLLAAGGVDNVPDSWLSRWTLLDFFLVLIAALATARLWSPAWGLAALLTLVLIWHETGAPKYVWVHVLAATALVRVLPEGRLLVFAQLYRKAFWLVLAIIAIPFMIDQIRTGLYPQLERPGSVATISHGMDDAVMPAPAAPEAVATLEEKALAPSRRSMAKEYLQDSVSGSYRGSGTPVEHFERIDPAAKVQTGPGLPQWHWHSVELSWNGSVDAGQKIKLWYLPPFANFLLNLLRVGLLTTLSLLMFGVAERWRVVPFTLKAVWPWLLVAPILAAWPTAKSYADIPDQAMLEALKNRLLEAPDCVPACAQIESMKLDVSDQTVELALQIHAQDAVSLPMPADYNQWFPNRVSIDGSPAVGLYRQDNGLWLNLSRGLHQVVLTGTTPPSSKFVLPLPLKPAYVSFTSDDWEIEGLQNNGVADSQLQISRSKIIGEKKVPTMLASGILPPFVRIERTLQLGLDWRVTTRVIRMSPANAPVVLTVPLWSGESVTTSGIRVKDGKANVNMAARQNEIHWESVLKKADAIELIAHSGDQWVEVWRADVSPIWHIESSGIAMMHMTDKGLWVPEWHPWPGEKLTLTVTRPQPAQGQTLTIDNSHLSINPGLRSRDVDLSLTLRSSQGGQHTLVVPNTFELQTVEIDGRMQPIRQSGGKLTIPVKPGEQLVNLHWRQPQGVDLALETPVVDLGQDSVNAAIHVALGEDRWVLLVMGPDMGPAVLFLGVLIVILCLSIGLARLPLTPLKYWQWFLLLTGLSQIPFALSLVVVLWLAALGWRNHQKPQEMAYFNLVQVMLAAVTFLSLCVLFFAVSQGLLSGPDMHVAGNQSSAHSLNWYQDRSDAILPAATVVSVPIKIYRTLMLAWSLWLAISLIDWLKWGWGCFSAGGFWLKKQKKAAVD